LSEQAFGLATHRHSGSKMHEIRRIQQAIAGWVNATELHIDSFAK
jgi:hypothetical protein